MQSEEKSARRMWKEEDVEGRGGEDVAAVLVVLVVFVPAIWTLISIWGMPGWKPWEGAHGESFPRGLRFTGSVEEDHRCLVLPLGRGGDDLEGASSLHHHEREREREGGKETGRDKLRGQGEGEGEEEGCSLGRVSSPEPSYKQSRHVQERERALRVPI